MSMTPSQSPTPSDTPSQTPAPSVDYVGIAAAASAASSRSTGILIGSILGGLLVFLVCGGVAVRIYKRDQLRQRRLRRMRAASLRNTETAAKNIYSVAVPTYYQQPGQPQRSVGDFSQPRPSRPQDHVRR